MSSRFTQVLFVVAILAVTAQSASAQLKFSDGTTQRTAFGGVNSTLTGTNATIAGGLDNTASASGSVIAGGESNTASPGYRDDPSIDYVNTVGGGLLNTASGQAATVAGGYSNVASGEGATVGGGSENTASGNNSTVAGGSGNVASGYRSFAAGTNAYATHDYSFVWGSETVDPGTSSTGENSFVVRATGGITFVGATYIYGETLVEGDVGLVNGNLVVDGNISYSGTIQGPSDRNLKKDFQPEDSSKILEKVISLPIESWRFKTDGDSVRHIGATAQDFDKVFGLGGDDRRINLMDSDGIMMLAIQALHKKLITENQQLTSENEKLNARLASIEKRLEEMEQKSSAAAEATHR